MLRTSDVSGQTHAVLSYLKAALQNRIEAKLDDTVRLCVYITDDSAAPKVRAEIAKAFPQGRQPAVTFVVTPLYVAGSLVAIDAVAVDRREPPRDGQLLSDFTRGISGPNSQSTNGDPVSMVSVPGERLILVSGQAEPGELRESVRKTCESLIKTVKLAGGDADTIAQVKIFMNSLNDIEAVVDELEMSGMERVFRSVSFVQWTSNLPPEIEVIAAQKNALPGDDAKEPIRFLTPPWMKESPVYSKVAVTNSDRLIFTSGLYGQPASGSETEVKTLFVELEKVMKDAGSDLGHLGKATYYVTNDEVSKQLNVLRPNYYDPKRPPAASKAAVKGVGGDGLTITLDMIAVPSAKK